jgi:septal ring factor EnvC (AmiA/AmiB activator)
MEPLGSTLSRDKIGRWTYTPPYERITMNIEPEEDEENMSESDYNPVVELLNQKEDEVEELQAQVEELQHELDKLKEEFTTLEYNSDKMRDALSDIRSASNAAL